MLTPDNYPRLSLADATQCLSLYQEGTLVADAVQSRTIGSFQNKADLQEVEETLERLFDIATEVDLQGQKNAQEFHTLASIELHQNFSRFGAPLRDPDFWRWVNFTGEAYGANLVDLRYGNETPGSAQNHYYGLGRNNQGLLSSLWLRADIVYDAENESDPYHLCKAISDGDFWTSHLIRLNYASCRNMAKAFVKFVFDKEIPRGDTHDKDNTGFRDLQPELVRRFATISFETMDQDAAYRFVEKVWSERDIWKIVD